MGILNWLKKPYPFVENSQDKWLIIIASSVFVSLFLIVFEPFDADNVTDYKEAYLSGFGLCVLLALLLCYFLYPRLFPKFYVAEIWTIGREIFHLTLIIICISILNYLYNSYVGKDIAVPKTLFEFFGITFAIGIFPLTFLTFFIERKLNKDHRQKAIAISDSLLQHQAEGSNTPNLIIQADTIKTKPIQLKHDDFLYAKSDNNYSTVFYLEDDIVVKKMLRISLKTLDKQFSEFENIIRCHRSYIVNKNNIKNVSGNARSLVLRLKGSEDVIPVSRSFSKDRLI